MITTKGVSPLPQVHTHVGRVRVGLTCLICVMTTAVPAVAQSASGVPTSDARVAGSLLASTSSVATMSSAPVTPVGVAPRRSLTLPALQVSFGALQVMDVVSTVRGLNAGLTEANVVMRGIAGRPMALAAVKAGAATASVLLVNRMARRNRAAAIATMAALNTAYSLVVVRNMQAIRSH